MMNLVLYFNLESYFWSDLFFIFQVFRQSFPRSSYYIYIYIFRFCFNPLEQNLFPTFLFKKRGGCRDLHFDSHLENHCLLLVSCLVTVFEKGVFMVSPNPIGGHILKLFQYSSLQLMSHTHYNNNWNFCMKVIDRNWR